MAVRATRLGAMDFLEKPLSTDKLLLTVENALKLRRLEDENRQLKQRLGKHEIVFQGEAMRHVMAQVERVAGLQDGPVLAGVSLRRADVTDAAVAVIVVVPADERARPFAGVHEVREALHRELRPVLRRAPCGTAPRR